MERLLETLLEDAKHLVDSDFPTINNLPKIVGALVKRLEQDVIDHTKAPAAPTQPAPSPVGIGPAAPVTAGADISQQILAAITSLANDVDTLATKVADIEATVDAEPDAPAPTPAPPVLVPDAPASPPVLVPAPDAPTSSPPPAPPFVPPAPDAPAPDAPDAPAPPAAQPEAGPS